MRADAIRTGDRLNGRLVTSVHVTRHHATIRTGTASVRYHRGQDLPAERTP